MLIGITVGYLVTIALGWTDFSGIAEEPIVRVVMPLQFGVPQFFLIPSLTMCLVVMIVFIEATGMFLALGAMTGRKVDAEDVKRGLHAIRSAPLSARSSTPFPMSLIRRISGSSASPAFIAAGCASPAASSCWCSA